MSVEKFKPQLWEGAMIANFHNQSIGEVITCQPTKINGKTITWNRPAIGNLKDYEGNVNWDDIDTTDVSMEFNKEKYFAFKLEDVDSVQLVGDVLVATTQEHSALMAEDYDRNILKVIAEEAKKENIIGSKSQKVLATPVNAYDLIVDLGTKLSQNKVPKINRYVTVNAEFLGLLSKDRRFTSNPTILQNGVVEGQVINTLQVVCSEELPSNVIVANYKNGSGAAKQIDEIEAMRLQGSFADGIRGLMVHGAKVLCPESVAILNYQIGTASDMPAQKVEVANVVKTQVVTEATKESK